MSTTNAQVGVERDARRVGRSLAVQNPIANATDVIAFGQTFLPGPVGDVAFHLVPEGRDVRLLKVAEGGEVADGFGCGIEFLFQAIGGAEIVGQDDVVTDAQRFEEGVESAVIGSAFGVHNGLVHGERQAEFFPPCRQVSQRRGGAGPGGVASAHLVVFGFRAVERDQQLQRDVLAALLAETDNAVLQKSVRSEDIRQFAAGQPVFMEGAAADGMYSVLEGEVEFVMEGKVREMVQPGGFFGELALLDDHPRSATAMARTDCTIAVVNTKRFQTLVQQTPFFALQVMRVMAERLRRKM